VDGERLRSIRKARGLSLRDLAGRVGVTPPAILKYEKGEVNQPNHGLILRIAHALEVEFDDLLRPSTVKLSPPSFRRRASLTKKQIDTILYGAKERLEEYLDIEKLVLDSGIAPFEFPKTLNYEVGEIKDIERVAKDLRHEWKLGLGPIGNVTEALEEKGVKICFIDGHEDFDACLTWADESIPFIICKRDIPGDRQRFNLCHELGHLILTPAEVICRKEKEEENMAYRFAGAFLVPDEVVHRELGNRRTDIHTMELQLLKEKYGLSMQGWIHRAKDLHIVSQATVVRLFRRFNKGGWHYCEPGPAYPPEQSTRMKRLVIQAIMEQKISISKGTDLLGEHFDPNMP
jgi:Zn-dependent peptidase ImmA (M78 family)/DNA-binding XRE family transcriptional regulator